MSFETIATLAGLLLTAIGLFYTGYQISQSRKVARGEFLLHLDEIFQQHNETHIRLRPRGAWADGKTGPGTGEEWAAVERYMGLFERVNILVEDGILDIDTVDRLYGYRVINILNNKVIREAKLEQEGASWQDFIKLRDRILKIRKDRFWQAYLSSLPAGHRHRTVTYATWFFGDTQQDAEVCAQLVKAGIKTATSGLLWEMEKEAEKLPEPGDIAIVTGQAGMPVCLIEVTECIVKPFNEVDEQFARDYGEGARTLKAWRKDSWNYFSAVCRVIGREPSETMPLACQRFRLLYP